MKKTTAAAIVTAFFSACLLGLLLFPVSPLFAQKHNAAYELHIRRAIGPIRIDGLLNEPSWDSAQRASHFYMVLPMDTSYAKVRTEVRMTYDDKNLYLSAECFEAAAGPAMVESLKRDWSFLKNDNFIFFMDPFEDQTSGFSFGTNAAGGQWDGLMYEGGKVDLSWDNKWTSEVRRVGDRWVLEMAVPFKTLRYKKGLTRWGINFSRNDLKTTEKSAWAPVPRQFPTASLAYTGVLVWDEAPPPPGPNISIIPYALGGVQKDFFNGKSAHALHEVGGDVKIAVTSSLNLDLTVNPDFSQVDVDKQVIDLSRFELFYPEKRQFFLENGDHFTNFGYASLRPFFSRRIGLGVPIDGGARLSGKLDRNWRIGVMDMQTRPIDSIRLPRQNFAVLALQRKVFARSNIGFIYIDKESMGYDVSKDSVGGYAAYSKYNRNLGVEFNLASSNNFWTGKALLLKSFSPVVHGHDYAHAGNLLYTDRHLSAGMEYEYAGAGYKAEVGYVPRVGYYKGNPTASYLFLPFSGAVLSHGPALNSTYYYNASMHHTDDETIFTWPVTFRSKAVLTPLLQHDYVELLAPFDPTNTGIGLLAVGTRHNWNTVGVDYVSKPQSVFTWGLSGRWGGYYADGTKLVLGNDLGFRVQPYLSIALSTVYTRLALPKPWGVADFWLVSPRVDLTMTNKLFFTTYVQYNEQIRNMNMNMRLQWRYKPASDLFIVYTDNYYTGMGTGTAAGLQPGFLPGGFGVKSRAVVVKLNYWWGL